MTDVSAAPGIYRIFNYTWLIFNEAGDIVNYTSVSSASRPWPDLEVNLCTLAPGADAPWGTPNLFWPQPHAANLPNHRTSSCDFWQGRASLTSESFYVCPGSIRARELGVHCSYEDVYFCASWGCETTGDAYWNPSSSWDLITVQRKCHNNFNNPQFPTEHCHHDSKSRGWCNTLSIKFTPAGKKYNWIGTVGAQWGLRCYIQGTDYGLIFPLQLRK